MALCHKYETMVHHCMISIDHGIRRPYEKLHDEIGLFHFEVSNVFQHKLLEKIIKQANSLCYDFSKEKAMKNVIATDLRFLLSRS